MNGNRMKYASTPTYGMQKRSFLKKTPPAHQAPEAPDFSKAPDATAPMAFQQTFGQPTAQQPIPQPVQQQPPAMPNPMYFPNPAAPMQQTAQIPFAAPSFVPSASGMQMPPMQTPTQPQQLPLGNTVPPFQNAFSSRSQGFVPPQTAAQPAASYVQPANTASAPFGNVPPFGGMNMGGMPQQTMNYSIPTAQLPPYPASPVQPAPQQMNYTVQPTPAPQRLQVRTDADKLLSLFLLGLLPLLFIPCLFIPGSWDFLRYIFLGFTVVGLGVMWYRQMFTSSTRLILSMVYVALCVAIIAMLLQGGTDVRRTSAQMSPSQVSQQQSKVPGELDIVPETPQPLPEETPAPVAAGPSEAERRLELFMSLWQINNTSEMVSLVQPSWCSQQENPSQSLFNVLMNRTPEDFVIEEVSGTDTDNSRTVTMRATINKNTGKAPTVYRFMVMMVKEGNEWYVNPNSLATNDEVETTDENVVNNKNAVGNVTEPPRTTVTPAPAASTLLYYNEGANYYHMDPNCVSVKQEYLPFDFSFSYGELKTVMNQYGLSPCLKCNAPTSTLD